MWEAQCHGPDGNGDCPVFLEEPSCVLASVTSVRGENGNFKWRLMVGTDISPVFEDALDVALVGGRDPVYLGGESIDFVLLSARGSEFLSVSI